MKATTGTWKAPRAIAICLISLAALAATFAVAVPNADAHYVYEREKLRFNGNTDVADTRSEISHGGYGGGYYKSNVTLHRCLGQGMRRVCTLLPQEFYAKQTHFKWNGGSRTWEACTSTDWKRNPDDDTPIIEIVVEHRDSQPQCGPGYYGNLTSVAVRDGNGGWDVESQWSGYHQFD